MTTATALSERLVLHDWLVLLDGMGCCYVTRAYRLGYLECWLGEMGCYTIILLL